MDSVLQELFNHLAEISLLFGAALFSAVLSRVQTWWKDRSIKRFERGINKNIKIRELLAELRALYDADRVGLWQLHNGEYYVSGGSIMKCSLTHFVTKVGIASPSVTQGIPTTHMLTTLEKLTAGPTAVFSHNSYDDRFQDALFATTGIETSLVTFVRDTRKNLIGILCASWIGDAGKIKTEDILDYSRQVGEFLSKEN